MRTTAQEFGSAPGKVSGRGAGDAAGMHTNPTSPTYRGPTHPIHRGHTHPIHRGDAHRVDRGVDPEELARHIAEMYRDVANEEKGDLHFPTGRPLAEALGYPTELLDGLPADAVSSFAGV